GQLAEEVPAPGRIARVDEVAGQRAGELLANGEMSPGDRVTAGPLRAPAGEGGVEARDLARSVRRGPRRASRTCRGFPRPSPTGSGAPVSWTSRTQRPGLQPRSSGPHGDGR